MALGVVRDLRSPVEQFLEHAGVFAWETDPAHADRFLGQGCAESGTLDQATGHTGVRTGR